jgi:DHA1 family multidrug resistance protein-like MFS transporter
MFSVKAISRSQAPARSWQSLLAAVCVAQATAIVAFDFTLPFIPLYLQHDLGVHGLAQTAFWSGLIGFGPAIPATVFGPLWGRLADRFGYRTMLLRAMISSAILLSLMALAPSPWVLLVLRILQGGLSGTVFSAQALVAAATPEKETARSMGILQMSVYIGATAGPVGGGIVAQTLGYRAAFISAGVLLALATLVVFAFVWEPVRRISQETETKEEETRPSLVSLLAIPAFLGALLLTLVVQLAATALFPVIPLFVQDLVHSAGRAATATGWIMAVSGVTGAIGSYAAGRLNRRLGHKPLLLGSLLLSAALLAPQAFVGSYLAFLLLRAAASFALGALISTVGTLAATSTPREAKGTAFGLVGAASSLGFGAGPLLGGSLVAACGIRPLFVLSASVLVLLPATLAGLMLALPVLTRLWPSLLPKLASLRQE